MHRLVALVLCLAWSLLLVSTDVSIGAAVALLGAALGMLCASVQGQGGGLALAGTVAASVGVALTHHAGILLLAWIVSGGALTQLVRREGGETSGKPGRVLELQQHASSVLLVLVIAAIVAAADAWNLSESPSGYHVKDRVTRLLSAAGLRAGASAWDLWLTLFVVSAAALRLGVFPFPFSLRRSARRLHGIPLLAFLAVFLPGSLCALARLGFCVAGLGGSSLSAAAMALGCVVLVTGALWLQVEWLGESIMGLVAQCYVGLALLAIGSGDSVRTTMVILQGAIASGAGGLWTMRMRQLARTSDLAKAADGYARHSELQLWHGLFVMVACPWPGSPGGLVWMYVIGRSLAAGTGFGLAVLLGILLLCCGLFRSIGKVGVRLSRVSSGTAVSHRHTEPQVESTG